MMDKELYQEIKELDIDEMDNFLVIIYNKGLKAMAERIKDELSFIEQMEVAYD